MTLTILFDDRRPNYQGAQDPQPRPMARVDVLPPPGSSIAPWHGMGLLDTGATGLFLPTQIAQRLGIPLTGPGVTKTRIWTANGFADMDRCSIDVQIHGVMVSNVEALFFPNQRVLIGRTVMFQFLQAIGFEQNGWLMKHKSSSSLPVPVAVVEPAAQHSGHSGHSGIVEYDNYVLIDSVRIDKNLRR